MWPAMRVARRGRDVPLTEEVEALLATFPADADLSIDQWKALIAMKRLLGTTLKELGAASQHFAAVASERGAPPDPDGGALKRFLKRRERTEYDAVLTRSLATCDAAIALGTWINVHHDVLNAAVSRRNGVQWPKFDVEMHLDLRADARRLRRALRGD